MAFIFGDSFDLYNTPNDMLQNYWDSGSASVMSLTTGRFSPGQALGTGTTGAATFCYKNSNVNGDTVHHLVCSFYQNLGTTSSSNGLFLQLLDGANAQCTIMFRADGAIVLTSGTYTGLVLATYAGAFNGQTWTAFEFEVVINNVNGSFSVRKNGNTSNDYSQSGLNTRGGSANNYANRLLIGMGSSSFGILNAHRIDDLLWRSDALPLPWVGDIRCYTRPATADVQAQFTRSVNSYQMSIGSFQTTAAIGASSCRYYPFTAPYSGTLGVITASCYAASTCHVKMAIYNNINNLPGTVLATSAEVTNPPAGNALFSFSPGAFLTKGQQYWIGINQDANWNINFQYFNGIGASTLPYTSFPIAFPLTVANANSIALPAMTATITLAYNSDMVTDVPNDGSATYVYDSNIGDNDLYSLSPLSITPAGTLLVTTRMFAQKSDAGVRSASVQLKSGTQTVQSPPSVLPTQWGWLWRQDTLDPNTGAAWTGSAVDALQIGPVVTG